MDLTLILITFLIIIFFVLTLGILALTCINIFHSIFSLIFMYFCAIWLFALIHVEFIAFIILIVYLGAITVIFLFISMMIPTGYTRINTKFDNYSFFLNAFICTLITFPLILITIFKFKHFNNNEIFIQNVEYSNIEHLGILLYTSHFPVIIFSGFILFLSIICIVCITNHK